MSQATPMGFFTGGVPPEHYELPHPRLGLPVILLIRRVLCRAFEILRESDDVDLAKAKEDEDRRPVLSEFDAIFVECKPVDGRHAVGSKYCDDGLIRFVVGDYAWAMQEGMMLAYVRGDRTIAGQLIPAMEDASRMSSLRTIELPRPCHIPPPTEDAGAERIHVSRHHRDFAWPDGKGQATDIAIYHLWHDCG